MFWDVLGTLEFFIAVEFLEAFTTFYVRFFRVFWLPYPPYFPTLDLLARSVVCNRPSFYAATPSISFMTFR